MGITEIKLYIKLFTEFYDLERPERLECFSVDLLKVIFEGLLRGVDLIDFFIEHNWYTADEMAEIIDGAAKGVDYTVYAIPDYANEMQMMLIKDGMIENINYSLYADPKYSWKHMYYIKKGLEENINVYRYLDPNLSIMEVIRIRKELLSA